ncbi:hypothetical protein Vretimale_18658 [Volvox reticuliferus]|uniref:Sulfotransferase n=1 Tax=Volvox reticuliferus TaxID=1737510 RepID=A0A8J4GVG3_9CHLO|nr:hypothetical protein Vretifemale_17158 [Volvox reticuliferus]GIM15988.1 hypothetical protein Vretimale_18658 [Volvox reticuliferus]
MPQESFFFSGELPRTTLCDNLVEDFLTQAAVQRLKLNRTDMLIGDWSATHFSCPCCPAAFKSLNANLKIIVVLRDPVQRALSRFVEQKRSIKMPLHKTVENFTFPEFVQLEVAALEACVARAASMEQPRPPSPTVPALSAQGLRGPVDAEPLVGWGAGLDIRRWMEMQCYSRSNIIGWSIYDVFLENYLAYFPKEQVLVLYTDDLWTQPLQLFERVEAFLGAPPHRYDSAVVNLVFNSHDCYHWRCARKKGDIKSILLAASSEEGPQQQLSRNGPFAQAVSRLVDLYRPHVTRLFSWAEQGRIASPPDRWKQLYG